MTFRRSLSISTLLAYLLFSQSGQTFAQSSYYNHHWPHDLAKNSLIERALSPDDSDVSFIINNLPVSYHPPREIDYKNLKAKFVSLIQLCEEKLPEEQRIVAEGNIEDLPFYRNMAQQIPDTSVEVLGSSVIVYYQMPAVSVFSPEDLIKSLERLACLEQKFGYKTEAENVIKQIIQEKEKFYGPKSMEVAWSCQLLGDILRSKHNYPGAEYFYTQALNIKRQIFGTEHNEVAACYMNLANLYYDALKTEEAESMLVKAEEITKNSAFISASHTDSPRPLPTAIFAPLTYHWNELISSNDNYEEKINMAKAEREAKLSAIKAMLIPPKKPAKTIPDGSFAVYGTAQLSLDSKEIRAITRDAFGQKITDVKKKEKVEAEAKDVSHLAVYLCNHDTKEALNDTAYQFGQKYGFSAKEFGKTWPGIKKHAEELLNDFDKTATSNLVSPKYCIQTDTNGEFEFKKVPPGNYYLYASLLTENQASCWLIEVTVTRDKPTRVDILPDNEYQTVWEKNRAAPKAKPI
ncbi:MAG: tetratricopeptide repeat protein [Candidatus Obscuribacterales bacterium]|nr:tetratricopeptide repeat protein [Candidatus Obscuribacterales bacterium]